MSTPVVDTMEAIAELWAGLTPPDRSDLTYHHLDENEVDLERGFRFGLPIRSTAASIAADRTKTGVEWVVAAEFHLARTGRGFFDFARAVANETSQLARAVEAVNQWPTGVQEVFVEPTDPDEQPDGAVVTFTFTILCEDS